MTCDAPVLSISRVDSSTVRLSWTAADPGDVSAYNLYRDTEPYQHYYPDGVPYQVFANPGATMFDDAILGNATTNYFYALRAVCADGGLSEPSGQVGKFEFTLYETTGTDYTWIAIPLDDPTLLMASDLATHIENNSSTAVAVTSISKWIGVSQTYSIYFHQFATDDFSIATKFPYRVSINIPGVGVGSVIWALVGAVPEITYNTYTLVETTGTDYNWIMQPLDLSDLVMASDLATHIENNSSAAIAVTTIGKWNATAQTMGYYFHQYQADDFAILFGYPYQITVDVTIGSSVTWPFPVTSNGDIFVAPVETRIYIPEGD